MRRPRLLYAAERLYAARRKRERIFGPDLFADGAWDILLDLFIAALERRTVAVSKACQASAVPATTALRCISALERAGYVVRNKHPHDRRSSNLVLTDVGEAKMRSFFEATGTAGSGDIFASAAFQLPVPTPVGETRIVFRR